MPRCATLPHVQGSLKRRVVTVCVMPLHCLEHPSMQRSDSKIRLFVIDRKLRLSGTQNPSDPNERCTSMALKKITRAVPNDERKQSNFGPFAATLIIIRHHCDLRMTGMAPPSPYQRNHLDQDGGAIVSIMVRSQKRVSVSHELPQVVTQPFPLHPPTHPADASTPHTCPCCSVSLARLKLSVKVSRSGCVQPDR